jgi:DNA polymerase III delta subunit
MNHFDKIECIIGDSFFFLAAEKQVLDHLKIKYNTQNIEKTIIDKSNNIDLMPSLFDFNPKLIILRNPNSKLLNMAYQNIIDFNNLYLLIEIESEKYDSKIKLFKSLEENNCITTFGYCNDLKKLNSAFEYMQLLIGVKINKEIRDFLKNNISKMDLNNKKIYNLNKIFNELKKVYLYDRELNVDETDLKEIINYNSDCNFFDITNSIIDKNQDLFYNIIDTYVLNHNDAKKLMNFIISELKIMCLIKEKTHLDIKEIIDFVNNSHFKYKVSFDDDVDHDKKEIHPYRIRKILEKKNSSFFNNCYNNLKLCIDVYEDLNNIYYNNFRIPLYSLFFKLS